MAEGITISSSNAIAIRAQFREFVQWNHRDQDFLAIDQSRRFANDLYNVTAEIAPTKAEIAADVRKQGWKIPAFFKDGRMGRGTARMWLQSAWVKKKKRLRKKAGKGMRGRNTGEEVAMEEAMLSRNRPTLAQMQAFVIKMRAAAVLFLASGWLGAIRDLGGKLNDSGKGEHRGALGHRAGVGEERSGAIINRAEGRVEVTFWNNTPGIVKMNAKHFLVPRAVAARIEGMQEYIRAHRDRAREQFLKKAA